MAPDFHSQATPFFRAIALKRHGHDVSGCDLDCGGLHHWENCRLCLERRGYAEFVIQFEQEILSATRADRKLNNGLIPFRREVTWAKKYLGIPVAAGNADPDDLPFE